MKGKLEKKNLTGRIKVSEWLVWAFEYEFGMSPRKLYVIFILLVLILSIVMTLRGKIWYEAIPISIIGTADVIIFLIVFAKRLDMSRLKTR